MATTRLEYTGDGNTVTFSLGTIDLINRSDLKVYIFEPSRDSNTAVLQSEATNAGTAGTSHPQYDASNTSGSNAGSIAATTPVNNYQFNSGNTQITLNFDNGVAKPSANALITLERITSELQSDFSSQGTIRASELNEELRRIQHIAEEGVNEAKLSIKESKFSANAVDVAHPTLGTDRKIEHVAGADSDDDAVNREQLRKVIFDDLIEGEGINLTDATGGTNSNGQTTISGEDSSKTNKGIVKINEGEAIDVNYTDGNAVISSENSTKSNKGAITVNSGHGIKVGPSDESDAGYDGNAVVSADRSTPTAQGIIKVNQVSGDAINVSHAVGGTVGDVTIGVDRSTTSQQGVVKIQSSVPITTTYTADGEVSLAINDNTVDLAKIRNDDVITSSELDASTTTSNYPTPDWDSDDSIATGKALAKRFDAIYYSHTTNKGTAPTETNWVEGKLWYDHLNDQTFSIWEKTGANTGVWRAITSGGTFTSQPKVVYVDSVNGNDINDGHRIIKAKKTIRGALLDVNENIAATTTTNVTAATYNHQTGLLTVTTNAAHNLRVGMKVTMAGLVWSCNYGGGTNNHTFPEADDPLRFVSNILSNTQFECQLETTVDTTLAHTYVSGGTVTNQAGRVGQGWMISVAAGTYQEVLPLRVEADNVSIVGTTMRSCFIHPSNTQRYDTSKDFNASDAVTTGTSEYNTMFEMNSGTYIWGFAFSGMKAGGWTTSGGSTASARGDATGYVPEASRNEQRTNVDPDATYGLPPVHGWIAAFRPNCSLKKSPYIQNCTSISDTDINNAAYDPVTQTGGLGGDKDSGMTAGGILVDGSVPSATSPLRSFVVDAFTQINMDGPGILCTNNGYAQLVSFFGTFCHYHAKSLNGGMLNLANCTTDYGRYGLIADGKSATTTFTSTVDGAKAAGQTSFNIDATTITSGYHGTGFNNSTANLRPGDNYLVKIGSDTYEIVSATPVGGSWTATSGWTVNIMKTNATNPAINDGLTNAITDGATVSFYQRSYISTGGHTFEYVGAGTDYRAAPENGGVPIEANEVINRNNGKVWQSSTNHVGKFKVGETFTIDQRSGKVESKGITLTGPVTTNGNDNITIDPAGTGTVTIGSALTAGNTTVGTLGASGDITFNTGNITTVSNANITLDPNGSGKIVAGADITTPTDTNLGLYPNGTGLVTLGSDLDVNAKSIVSLSNGNIPITPNGSGKVILDGLNWPTADGTANYFLKTDGSGQLSWGAAASTSSPTISNPTVTGNLVVTDNLRLNDDDDSNHITITAPAVVGTNYVLTMPAGAPSANQYLKAGASTPGNLEWENQLAITTVQTAANESAMLGLTTQEGDVVIRTDESKTYIKNSGTAGSMADFTHLVSPTGTVTTVDGHSGTVTANDIRDAVESATDSNTFTDAESSKLAGIATSANNYTHPNHSGEVTSTADGATVIADDTVDEANLKISNAGTNGQYLQKQSGNTGGLTWADVASGGPSITANANGALAAGDPVAMQTDGTVKKIVQVTVNDSAPSNAISDVQVSSGSVDRNTLAISPEGIGLCLYTDAHSDFSSNKIMIRPFKIGSDDTVTLGTATQIGGGTVDDFRVIWSITNNGNPVFITQYRGTSTHSADESNTNTGTRYSPFMVNASSLAITRGTGLRQSENCKEPDIIRSGTSGEFLALQPIQGTCYWRIYKYDNSSSTVGNLSLEDYAHQGRHQGGYSGSGDGCDVSFRYSSLLHDPDRDEILLFTQDEANGSCTMQYDKGQTVWLDIWNSTDFNTTGVASPKITRPKPWNTNHVGMTNRLQARYINSCYDTTNDRVVVVFTDEDQSNKTYIMAGTNNGKSSASISWGTPVELDTSECYSVQCVWDPNQEKVLVSYGDPGDNNKWKWMLCTVNASNNSVSIGTVFTDTHLWDTSDYNSNERGGPEYDPITKRFVRFYRKDADSNVGYLFAAKTSSATTTAGEFIGFAQAAVSSGAAATIDITGSINESQSSLTTGSKYFVNNQGGLQTTADDPSVYAGLAASATKIIVKDQEHIPTVTGTLTEYDIWSVTSDSSSETWDDHVIGSGSPTAVSIARQTSAQNPRYATIGSGMVYSAGVWSFPSTGYWECTFRPLFYANAAGLKQKIKMELTENNGTSWNEITRAHTGGGEQFEEPNATVFNLLNITNISQQKLRFLWESDGDNSIIQGATGQLESHWVFKKIY